MKKLENSVLKLYAIGCIQNRQPDKLREFFERLTPDIQVLVLVCFFSSMCINQFSWFIGLSCNNVQAQAEWKDWFSLPYLKDPQESPAFSIYFSRHWQVI